MGFIFNAQQGAQSATPDQVKRWQAIADAMAQQNAQTPTNVGEGLNAIGRALVYRQNLDRADQGERQGQQQAQEAIQGLTADADPSTFIKALSNPWVADNPGESAVASALFERQMKQSDPAYKLGLDKTKAEIANMGVSPGYRWNADHTGEEAIPNGPADPANPLNQNKTDSFAPLSADDVKALGLPPGAYQKSSTGKIDQIGGAGTNVTVNSGENSSPFAKAADEAAAKRYDDMAAAGTSAQQFTGDLKALSAVGKQVGTGKGQEIVNALGPYAQMVGIDVKGLPEDQAYQAIIARLAPQMRAPGSGASSDFDAKQFLSSLPQLGNTPEGNAIITQTFSAIQQSKIAAAEIANKVLSGEITWQKGDQMIAALGNPYDTFNTYKQQVEKSPGANDKVPASAAADGVTQSDWDHMPPESKKLWH